jgi:hypothetical protein
MIIGNNLPTCGFMVGGRWSIDDPEKRADHAMEAFGADVGIAALAVEGQRRQLTAVCHCVENLPTAAVALGHEVPPPLPGQAERPNEPA